MATIEQMPETLAVFAATCEALGVPPGSTRLDAFLRLPQVVQERVWAEVVAPDRNVVGVEERP